MRKSLSAFRMSFLVVTRRHLGLISDRPFVSIPVLLTKSVLVESGLRPMIHLSRGQQRNPIDSLLEACKSWVEDRSSTSSISRSCGRTSDVSVNDWHHCDHFLRAIPASWRFFLAALVFDCKLVRGYIPDIVDFRSRVVRQSICPSIEFAWSCLSASSGQALFVCLCHDY